MKPLIEPHLQHVRRTLWSGWLALVAGVILISYLLVPSPLGYGTHEMLGLPPCGVLAFTGIPCPSCGLTTCFAHIVRMQWLEAWGANPWGFALFGTMAASVPVAFFGAYHASPVLMTCYKLHVEKVSLVLLVLGIVSWLVRVFST
ncbi:MAG: DUF2752 domain-containing protein [Myxococcales bacterium]|nr:DUF2752 domain-containing protein [Myxococcales bacterium]